MPKILRIREATEQERETVERRSYSRTAPILPPIADPQVPHREPQRTLAWCGTLEREISSRFSPPSPSPTPQRTA
jgi:hypothetical protein